VRLEWARRETGADDGSIGLRRSLTSLAANPRMARRDWYEQQVRQCGDQRRDGWGLADRRSAEGVRDWPLARGRTVSILR